MNSSRPIHIFPPNYPRLSHLPYALLDFFCRRPHRCGVTFSPAFLQPVSQAHTHRYTSIHLRTRWDRRRAGRGLQSAGSVSRAEDERTPGSGAVQTHAYIHTHTYLHTCIHTHTHTSGPPLKCALVSSLFLPNV